MAHKIVLMDQPRVFRMGSLLVIGSSFSVGFSVKKKFSCGINLISITQKSKVNK